MYSNVFNYIHLNSFNSISFVCCCCWVAAVGALLASGDFTGTSRALRGHFAGKSNMVAEMLEHHHSHHRKHVQKQYRVLWKKIKKNFKHSQNRNDARFLRIEAALAASGVLAPQNPREPSMPSAAERRMSTKAARQMSLQGGSDVEIMHARNDPLGPFLFAEMSDDTSSDDSEDAKRKSRLSRLSTIASNVPVVVKRGNIIGMRNGSIVHPNITGCLTAQSLRDVSRPSTETMSHSASFVAVDSAEMISNPMDMQRVHRGSAVV